MNGNSWHHEQSKPLLHTLFLCTSRYNTLTVDNVKKVSLSPTILSLEASVEALSVDLTTRVWTSAMEEPSLILGSWRIPLVHLLLQVDVLAIQHRILDSLNCGECPYAHGGPEMGLHVLIFF